MSCNPKVIILLIALVAASLNFNGAMARPLASSSTNLMARLKLDQESSNCWDSLIQLQACTNEILLFFLNGQTKLGIGCCHAIRTITEQCWPNLIDTLGFTTEEEDILEGYCIKETQNSPPSLPSPSHVVPNKLVLEQSLFP